MSCRLLYMPAQQYEPRFHARNRHGGPASLRQAAGQIPEQVIHACSRISLPAQRRAIALPRAARLASQPQQTCPSQPNRKLLALSALTRKAAFSLPSLNRQPSGSVPVHASPRQPGRQPHSQQGQQGVQLPAASCHPTCKQSAQTPSCSMPGPYLRALLCVLSPARHRVLPPPSRAPS